MRLRISRKESARIISSNNPKGSWKGYKGLKPPGWGFPKDKVKNWPESFPRTTRKGYGKDTKARLEISER
jgi:hypothetical protein